MRKSRLYPIIHIKRLAVVLIFAIVISLLVLLMPGLFNVWASTTHFSCDPDNRVEIDQIENRLLEVGLKNRRYLNSTGIREHINRLCDGDVSPDQLYQYADQIELLSARSGQFGESIPPTFWDVQTPNMKDNDVTEYDVVNTLVITHAEYLELLSRAYNRFYDFKDNGSPDTALDAAIDIFLLSVDYTRSHVDTTDTYEIGAEGIREWQQVIGSADRTNPITGGPIFPYSSFSHLSVTNMWRHHTGRNDKIGLIWGVSGFDQRFVGERTNNNQIEHMSVSTALQYVFETPLGALNALEYRDLLNGRQSMAMSKADQTVNNIIAYEFLPRYTEDYVAAIKYLRCVLSSPEENMAQCS